MGDRRAVMSAGSAESSYSSGMALVGPAGASARGVKAIGRSRIRAAIRSDFRTTGPARLPRGRRPCSDSRAPAYARR